MELSTIFNADVVKFYASSKSAVQSCTEQLKRNLCNALNPTVVLT